MLIVRGLMQKMLSFLRRRWANTMPHVMAAGNAGGTAIVTTSSVFYGNIPGFTTSCNLETANSKN
jgi:hypothetical protein